MGGAQLTPGIGCINLTKLLHRGQQLRQPWQQHCRLGRRPDQCCRRGSVPRQGHHPKQLRAALEQAAPKSGSQRSGVAAQRLPHALPVAVWQRHAGQNVELALAATALQLLLHAQCTAGEERQLPSAQRIHHLAVAELRLRPQAVAQSAQVDCKCCQQHNQLPRLAIVHHLCNSAVRGLEPARRLAQQPARGGEGAAAVVGLGMQT